MKWLFFIVRRSLKLFGFIVSDLLPKYKDEFYQVVPGMVADGELKYIEDAKQGLEHAGDAIREVWQGKNRGKSVVIVGTE